jgi:hypothetical protein
VTPEHIDVVDAGLSGVDALRNRGREGRRWFVYPSPVLVCGWQSSGVVEVATAVRMNAAHAGWRQSDILSS